MAGRLPGQGSRRAGQPARSRAYSSVCLGGHMIPRQLLDGACVVPRTNFVQIDVAHTSEPSGGRARRCYLDRGATAHACEILVRSRLQVAADFQTDASRCRPVGARIKEPSRTIFGWADVASGGAGAVNATDAYAPAPSGIREQGGANNRSLVLIGHNSCNYFGKKAAPSPLPAPERRP